MSILSEISEKWKLEAKQEDNMRYFFGKSAISQHILKICNGIS